ncbi:MAG: diguanylate cyclase domain-containing protein [Halanaerobium sp.]
MLNFFNKYKLIFIVTAIIIIFSISYINYQNTEKIIRDNYQQKGQLVEKNIINSFSHVNQSYSIFEKQLNQDMRLHSEKLVEKYQEEPDIYSWNLEEMQSEFEGFDIYIIDSDLTVIRSTIESDIGLDFKQFANFSRMLRDRLEGDQIAIDRLDLSINTGEIKKYSYMPTPDNKYLLELSADIKNIFPELIDMNMYSEAENISGEFESVENIYFYKYFPESGDSGRLRTQGSGLYDEISEIEKEYIEKAYKERQVVTVENYDEENHDLTLIPHLVEESEQNNPWDSYLIGINYNNNVMLTEINKTKNLFLINAFIMFLVFVILAASVIYLLNRFEFMAYHDQLTKLANRELFVEKTKAEMNKNSIEKTAVIFIDINNFKEINDNFGHDIGDKILRASAEALKEVLTENDYICRMSGIEFALSISGLKDTAEVEKKAAEIIRVFNQPLKIGRSQFFISVSLGISIYPDQGDDLEELFKKADHAMYRAKKEQRDYVIYNDYI